MIIQITKKKWEVADEFDSDFDEDALGVMGEDLKDAKVSTNGKLVLDFIEAIHVVERKHAELDARIYNSFGVGTGAPVYLAVILEYLAAEVLELAGNAARGNKKSRIIPRHVLLVVRNDGELGKLLV
ncbi:uncharacterized protein LOC131228804 [Magnolia sinica]|uniref:uncharacterized protein LOC131228804 n=1 Tax=Magnolia sinica TaxID=86752 RepID=UPI00265AD6BE|nr:uncharacterized protein LOC131228804 [Magnolia sinica]